MSGEEVDIKALWGLWVVILCLFFFWVNAAGDLWTSQLHAAAVPQQHMAELFSPCSPFLPVSEHQAGASHDEGGRPPRLELVQGVL